VKLHLDMSCSAFPVIRVNSGLHSQFTGVLALWVVNGYGSCPTLAIFCYISLSTYSFFVGWLGSVGLGFSIRISVTVLG